MVTKNKLLLILFCGAGIVGGMIGAESFVVSKKKSEKKLSTSQKQEECCQALIEIVRETSKTVELIGQEQQIAIEMIAQIAEGDFFSETSKSDLSSDHLLYKNAADQACQVRKDVQKGLDFLINQCEKKNAKKVK